MRTVSRRLMPVDGSKRERRASPESTTMRTPSIVRLVSAMFVASTTLRSLRVAGRSAASCSAADRSPKSGSTRTPRGRPPSSSMLLRATDLALVPAGTPGCRRAPRSSACAMVRAVSRARCRSRAAPTRAQRAASRPLARLDVEGSSFARSRSGASPSSCATAVAVERRRHHQDAQVLAHVRLRIQAQRQAEIGVEAALVKLVEDHHRDAFERRRRVAASA